MCNMETSMDLDFCCRVVVAVFLRVRRYCSKHRRWELLPLQFTESELLTSDLCMIIDISPLCCFSNFPCVALQQLIE